MASKEIPHANAGDYMVEFPDKSGQLWRVVVRARILVAKTPAYQRAKQCLRRHGPDARLFKPLGTGWIETQ